MTLSNIIKMAPQEFQVGQSATADITLNLEVAVSAPLEGATPAVSGDWAYSATAEGRTGEVAVNGIDMDDAPGVIYSGPSGVAVRVQVTGFDIDLAIIAPAAINTLALGLYLNNTLVDYCDEGFVTELDDEVVDEFNLDTYVGAIQEGDVIRMGYVQGTENAELDFTAVVGGSLNIS